MRRVPACERARRPCVRVPKAREVGEEQRDVRGEVLTGATGSSGRAGGCSGVPKGYDAGKAGKRCATGHVRTRKGGAREGAEWEAEGGREPPSRVGFRAYRE